MMRNKYQAIKTTIDGIEFDSRKEARRYQELLLLQRAGVIQDLKMQVKYILIPAQYETFERYGKNGKRLKDGHEISRGTFFEKRFSPYPFQELLKNILFTKNILT